jgi:hypothetical protein
MCTVNPLGRRSIGVAAARALAGPSLALLAAAAAAQGVQRCEAPDGKVTYSNTKCPEGTTPVRQVNTSPPIAVDEQKAARDRARRDAAEARDVDKSREQEAAREKAEAERAAAEQKKAQAKARERCDKARAELERARNTRASLMQQRAATIEEMQKADRDIGRREADVSRACPG